MDGVGSFGLPAGLSLAEQGHQARESADVTSRRRTKESKSAAAAAAASKGGRSNTGSTSATGASSSSETRNSKGNGYPLQESSSDEDEVSLASLASLAGAGGSRRTSRMSGTHFHESKSSGSTKGRRRGDRSSSKRRKLVESTGSGRSSSLDDSSSAYTNHVANNAGRRRKQQKCRQLQIGAFLSASSSILERSINSSIGTSASAKVVGTSSSDRTDTVTNDDDVNSTAVAASNTRDKLIGGSDSPIGMTQQPSGGIGRVLGENGGTTTREDGDAFDEAHVCLKPKLNAMQFGMQQLCAASALPGRANVNVLSELFRRSYPNPNPNSRGGSSLSTLRRFANAPNKWTKCETVRLPGHRHSTVALEFDRQGVLLALGDARGMITVYDFDELCGADMAARRASPWRQMHIRPVLAFGTHSTARISCIKWDPNNDDLLVVSFSTDCRIRIFDLISGSEAGGPNHTVLSDADSLRGRFRTEGNISIHHLPPSSRKVHQLLSGGSYGTVRLWYYPNSRRQKKGQLPTLAWSLSPFLDTHTEGVSEICHLENCSFPSSHSNDTSNGSGLILVGGSKGSLAIIDQDRRSKKAFSTKLTPTILWSSNVGRYITRRRLVDGVLPSNSWMGIKKIVLWGESSSAEKNSPATVRNAPSEEARMTIVTNCGWTLHASIRGLGRTSRKSSDFSGESTVAFSLQIAHKTAKTMWLNSDLEEIVVGENASTFSLPLSPPPVCTLGRSNLLAIASVKRNVKVMSNKDKRVLSSLPDAEIERLCQDDGDAILLVDASIDRVAVGEHQGKLGSSDSFVVSKIPLGDGTPQALAVHPAGQWMIVGCSDEGREELTLFCQRSKP